MSLWELQELWWDLWIINILHKVRNGTTRNRDVINSVADPRTFLSAPQSRNLRLRLNTGDEKQQDED